MVEDAQEYSNEHLTYAQDDGCLHLVGVGIEQLVLSNIPDLKQQTQQNNNIATTTTTTKHSNNTITTQQQHQGQKNNSNNIARTVKQQQPCRNKVLGLPGQTRKGKVALRSWPPEGRW